MHFTQNLIHHLAVGLISSVVLSLQLGLAQDNAATEDASHTPPAATKPEGIVSQLPSNSAGQKDLQRSDSSTAQVLGPGDEVEITVYGAPDLSGHTRVNADGDISMPLIGYVRVAGLTSSEAEGTIESKLRQQNILNDPQVSLYLKEYTSGSVSVAGEVTRPGPYSVLGPHRLFDVLQAAGGLTEKAANRVVISHRNRDNPTTVDLPKDPTDLARNNVEILPGDTVVVPTAPIVYLLGEVNKPGGYVLGSTNGMTLLRVVAAAGGPTHEASIGSAKMLRRTPSGLQELQLPLKKILQAKAQDMPVQGEDIIYIPRSRLKASLAPGALLNTAAAVALYRIP